MISPSTEASDVRRRTHAHAATAYSCATRRRAARPDLREPDDRRGRGGHLLHRGPLAHRVVLVAAVEDVRRRQAHLGQQRAVGAAADRRADGLDPLGRASPRSPPRPPPGRARCSRACCGTGGARRRISRAAGSASTTPPRSPRRASTCESSRSSSKSRRISRISAWAALPVEPDGVDEALSARAWSRASADRREARRRPAPPAAGR